MVLNGSRLQNAIKKRKAANALGELINDATPEDTLPPEQVEQVETHSAAKEKQRVEKHEADQIRTMLLFTADRDKKTAAAAEAVEGEESPEGFSARCSTTGTLAFSSNIDVMPFSTSESLP